jgi:hypothetical protein
LLLIDDSLPAPILLCPPSWLDATEPLRPPSLPIAPFFAWRFAGDYLNAPTLLPAGGTPARFSTGLVFRF